MSERGPRSRSNSRSQGAAPAAFPAHAARPRPKEKPGRRPQADHHVTLVSLNDTFVTKHIHVPVFPDTARLGRPTGTKVKPHVTNGYFDSRVLSRNHACMFVSPETGLVMVQDMGSSNGTFVNSEKLAGDPVPVRAGDVINLGFNIQVETNHKQISARVDSINVVSNSPAGPVSARLPRLSAAAVDGFSDADLKHYDMIQALFAEIQRDGAGGAAAAAGGGRAFDAAMFADVVPTLEETFAAATDPNTNAGIYPNSPVVHAPELQAAVDFLTVTLARVKQQNAALRSVDAFLANYSAQVSQLSARHVQGEVDKLQQEAHAAWSAERTKAASTISSQTSKLASQSRLVSSLEQELSRLKDRERERDAQRARDAAVREASVRSRPEPGEPDVPKPEDPQPQSAHPGSAPAVPADSGDSKHPSPQVHTSPQVRTSPQAHTSPKAPASPQACPGAGDSPSLRDLPADSTAAAKPAQKPSSFSYAAISEMAPFVDHMQNAFLQYKTQGVAVGFFVVVAGFLYQNTKQ